jgi:hypothetical protein
VGTALNIRDGEDGREISSPPRSGRRLADKILIAFHHACDVEELDIADQLLRILEASINRPGAVVDGNRRRNMENLIAAHERLWYLRHPVSQLD